MPKPLESLLGAKARITCNSIVPRIFASTQYPKSRSLPDLTDIIQALEDFQHFEPETRAAAIALYASELGIAQLHFYAIALHAGLGGKG